MKTPLLKMAAVAATFLVVACTKQETAESPKFDPRYVAAEADNGNLGPLKELNAACSTEVEKSGKRGAACKTQDAVGSLRKPLRLSF